MADITEQKQAEEALRQSEELFAKVFSASPAGITLTRKADGRILEVNSTYLKMVGYSRDEVMNHTTLEMELIFPEDRARLLKIFEEQGRVRDFEYWIKMKSGTLRAVLSSLEQVQIGETTCFLTIIYDITERKQIEAALQESEERYRLMIENIKDYAIFLLDPQGNVKTWNAGAEYIKGYSADQIIGRSFSTFYQQEDIESSKPEKILRQAAIEGRAEDEGWRVRKDGSRFWAYVTITALYNASGQLRGFSKVARNITERKQAEIAQQQSEALFRALFELSPDSVVIIDPHHPDVSWPIIDCNDAACFMNGYRRDELIGRSIDILNGTSAPLSERQAYMELLREKGILKAEFQHRSKDGVFFPIETSTALIRIGDRELIIGIDRNITERKRAEELLNNTNEKLKNGLAELDQRNREMMLLTELSNLLQACQTSDEAYMIISETVSKIFPDTEGALYMIKSDENLVQAAAVWGAILPEERNFTQNDCLALRRRRPHFVAEDHLSLQCKHILTVPISSICVPMISQEGIFGIFHLRHIGQPQQKDTKLFDQGLVETVADTVALAITNLMLRETLRSQSIRDPLTGLYNRRFMDESLQREIHQATRNKRSLGIIMLDLDHFKKFNDTFGHEAGDAVLRELGNFLKNYIRKGDIACRYGGEEFLLLLPEASLENTSQRAQKLCNEVRNIQVWHRDQMLGDLTLSIGVAVFPAHGQTADDVVRAADAALYRAKREGRNQVMIAE
jgi:diguanylate cyclase (GGDEF)-like protein/PAS domain S-box-containing protein